MNRVHSFLLELAKRNATVYAALPEVTAVVIGGSVSRGKPTLYSDIDTIIICRRLPAPAALAEACQINGGERREVLNQDADGLLEHYYIRNIECQFAWGLEAEYDRRLKEVLTEESLDPVNHLIMSGTMDALVLHGQDYIDGLRRRLAQFPHGLQVKMVEKFIGAWPVEEIRWRLLREESLIWFYSALTAAQRGLLGALFGLNRLYHPGGFRKIDYHIGNMELAPPDLYRRLNRMFRSPPEETVTDMGAVFGEVLDLIERHLPEADVSQARTYLDAKQQPMDLPE